MIITFKTFAMYQISMNMRVTRPHKPFIRDSEGRTAAMHFAMNGKKVEKWALHDIDVTDNFGKKVITYYLERYNECPEEFDNPEMISYWLPRRQDEDGNTYLMKEGLKFNYFPPGVQQNPWIRNKKGQTFLMLRAKTNLKVPKWSIHDPMLIDNYGRTAAMYFAIRGYVPKMFQHNKHIKDMFGRTAAMYYKNNNKKVEDWAK